MSNNHDFQGIGPVPPDGDRNWAGILIGVNWAVFTPALFVVSVRLWSRTFFTHNLGWDDFFMVITELLNVAGMAFVMLEVRYGLGRHKHYINPDHYTYFLKYSWFDWNQVILTLAFCKLSICFFLLRISKFEAWRKFLYGVIAFLVLTHLPLELLYLLQCIPITKNWYPDKPGRCFSKVQVENIIIIQGSFSIASDLALAAFPVLLLYHMRLPRRQKILLNMLLGLGIVTAMVCIARTAFSYEIKAEDQTWEGIPNALCRMLEINFGIIASCMPMVRTFVIQIKRRLWTHNSESLPSTRTPASQLQWYRPPTLTPWYRRVIRNSRKQPRPQVKTPSQPSASSSNRSIPKNSPTENEKVPRPPNPARPPKSPRPRSKLIPRSMWPQHYERPENATWAKNDSLKRSDSIDLPIQGPRQPNWIGEQAEQNSGQSTYRYDRGWA